MSGAAAWADAMQALALFAADPISLGGISVRAGAGPVRERFVALLLQALPVGMPVRRLPLHAGDDRLLGGLDLAATLQAGRPVAQKGLLAEADGGIVLLAMAERLEPGTAARLRAAIDDGAVTLQREGLSRVLPARFGIVALDEGAEPEERPPDSLMDRMAFHLDLTSVSLSDVTALIEDPPERAVLDDGPSAEEGVEALCHTAVAFGVTSIRAPLLALRAARAAAGLSGRTGLLERDLAVAARLVFGPRATCLPSPEEPDAAPQSGRRWRLFLREPHGAEDARASSHRARGLRLARR